ncbi:MAG: CpsD/CapB family tyrosine-protein kinase [Gammaproteobacteria bacterium]|nr:CpsD/CapB family tyrosine-protein kinase [Gammaproteobacteria bacterium]MBU1483029.1 CpsD/CapB family tyrosine-protein kinase [Gammaproteobacteria bacterium]
MERIKQAIEKVKAQQTGETGRARPHLESPGVARSTPIAKAHEELGDIRYEYTRVVKLQMDHIEQNRIVAFNKNDPKGMSFDLLRTHVLQKMEENGWRTLAITSPTPEAGKTVVAINLAMSIAQQTNRTAMLVDFDLRRPKVGAYLGIPMERSLNDMLDGTVELRDVLVNPNLPRLVVLPTRSPVENSSETLSSKRIADLTKELRERYKSRIVIFDLPPLLVADDAIALLPQIDCVLMVVANGMSTKREIEDSLRLLPAEKLIGTVLNKADVEPMAYYYD